MSCSHNESFFDTCNSSCSLIPPSPTRVLNALNANTGGNQSVASNALLAFNTNNVISGNRISHVQGSAIFTISGPGVYQVLFNTSAFINGGITPLSRLALVIQLGTTPIPGTNVNVNLSDDTGGVLENISVSSLFRVSANTTVNLSVLNLTATNDAVYNEANISIIRLS